MNNKHIDLSIIAACYREAEHIRESLPMLEKVLIASEHSYELIVIDDASDDKTPDMLREMFGHRSDVTLRFHDKNQGRGATVQEGIRLARGEVAGFLDIDLEVGPWYILPAFDALHKHEADVVIGHRVYKLSSHPVILLRHILSLGYRTLVRTLLQIPVSDPEVGFKFFRRKTILPVLDKCKDHGWFWDTEITCLAHREGLKLIDIPCLFLRRKDKTSTVNVLQDTWTYLTHLTSFIKRQRKKN